MEQLSGLDTLFVAGECETMPMHIGALLIYQSSTRQYFNRIHTVFEQRIGNTPLFRRRLVEPPLKLDNPYWEEDPEFSLNHHLQRIRLPAGSDADALEQLVADLHARGLDMNKPLWEAWVIDGLHHLPGYEKGSYGIYFKVHHSAIDGISGTEIIAALNDIEPLKPKRQKMTAPAMAKGPGSLTMGLRSAQHAFTQPLHLLKAWRQARQVPKPDSFDETPMHWTKSPLNRPVTGQRIIETVSLPFEDIRNIRRQLPSTTVNHVILTVVGGAIRHYLEQTDELPEFSLGAAVPMNLRTSDDATGGNIIGAMLSSLCTDIEDPMARLEQVRNSAIGARGRSETISRDVVNELMAGLPRRASELAMGLFQQVSRRPGGMPLPVHTIVSNIPGPPIPLYLGGDTMLDLRVYGLVFEPIGLFHTLVSYNDRINLSVLACPQSLREPKRYRQCLMQSFNELVLACQ